MPIITQSPRIVIRTYEPRDEEPYIDMLMDERVNRYLPQRTEEQHRQMFQDSLNAPELLLNRWAIVSADDDTFYGMCLLRRFNEDDPTILEVGYSLNMESWGKGIATEMVQLLVNYARTLPGVTKLAAVTDEANGASQNVLLKCGFKGRGLIERYEGLIVAYFDLELE